MTTPLSLGQRTRQANAMSLTSPGLASKAHSRTPRLSRRLVALGGVTTAAAATGKAASEVLSNARELDNQSGMLRGAVDEFLAKVRAA